MPRYDFRCTPCQQTFEATIPFGSDDCPPCPHCGKRAVEKVISPPMGIHFRGSGFYKTDSRPQKGAEGIKETEGTKGMKETEKSPTPETPKEKTAKAPVGSDAPAKQKTEKPAK